MLVFLFTDIEGSTRLWEKHTQEMGGVISRHDAILRQQIGECGGRVAKHTGDGVFAAFEVGEPVTCALEIQKRFATESWVPIEELRIRVGLHAGDAERRGDDYFGPTVNCTARIMAAAWGGQILLTPQVIEGSSVPAQATLQDLGLHLLKDVSEPQHIYELTHPDLPWQEFPPLRSLSSNAISQSVGEQGSRLASLAPPAMAVGLVSATLLPTVMGDLPPASPALAGNLGVLADLGAHALGEFLAEFVERLRAEKRTGQVLAASEIRQQLEVELLKWWEAGDEASVALRSDASRLLQAVQVVEATLCAATDEVQEALAQRMASLGGSFREFRWMVDGLQETLAEVRVGQTVQLVMQRAQLDMQRQQLVKTDQLLQLHEKGVAVPPAIVEMVADGEGAVAMLLRRLRQSDVDILDLPSLAVLYASRGELEIGPREAGVLVRSALHHEVDVRPWLRRVGSPEEAVRVLDQALDQYPKPQVRLQIVDGLESLQADEATDALLHIALTDDVPEIRAKAAVAAVQRGRVAETMAGLIDGLNGSNQAVALAAFVAVADEVGIPKEVGPYPKTPVFLGLAWRRWQAKRGMIIRQTIRAGLGGAIMSLFGCLVPLFYYLAFPEDYYSGIEMIGLSAWVLSSAMLFLLIGTLQGVASGLALGVADALWHDIAHSNWRLILGVGSGLALSMLLILLSLWGVASPEVGAGVFIPVYIIYGLVFGAAATIVIPQLGATVPVGRQLRRAAAAILVTVLITVPYVFLVYPNMVAETLAHRLAFAVVFPLTMAPLFARRTKQVSDHQNPPTEDRGF